MQEITNTAHYDEPGLLDHNPKAKKPRIGNGDVDAPNAESRTGAKRYAIGINSLPDEILIQIFAFVPIGRRLRLECVSDRWYRLMPYSDIVDVDLVQCLHGDSDWSKMQTFPSTDGVEELAMRGAETLQRVSFGSQYLLVTPRSIVVLATYCKQLRHLNMSYCKVTDSIVPALEHLADQLESLNLANTVFFPRDRSGHVENMERLFSKFQRLKSLNLQKTSIYNMSAVSCLPNTLESINLNNCSALKQQYLVEYLTKSTNLKELRLSAYERLDEVVLESICGLTNLQILELSHLAFSDLIGNNPTAELDFGTLERLVNLEELYVNHNNAIDSQALQHICVACRKLRNLDLTYCRNISQYRPLITLPALRQLYVGPTNAFNDLDIVSVAAADMQLETLDVRSCPITDAGIWALSDHCYGSIRELSVSQADDINDKSVMVLLKRAQKLEKLALQNAKLTDKTMRLFAKIPRICESLRQIDFSYCSEISDIGMECLIEWMKSSGNREPVNVYVHQTKVTRAILEKVVEVPLKINF